MPRPRRLAARRGARRGHRHLDAALLEAHQDPYDTDAALEKELSDAVVHGMGASYRPRQVLLVSDLPKTRNAKIMRRVIRAAYLGQLGSAVLASAALDLLGPAWAWSTPVWIQGTTLNGVLDGNLVIKGQGADESCEPSGRPYTVVYDGTCPTSSPSVTSATRLSACSL